MITNFNEHKINTFISKVFNRFNGKINTFIPAKLIINWTDDQYLGYEVSGAVTIFPLSFVNSKKKINDEFTLYANLLFTVLHELYHIELITDTYLYSKSNIYKEYIENIVDNCAYKYIKDHEKEMYKLIPKKLTKQYQFNFNEVNKFYVKKYQRMDYKYYIIQFLRNFQFDEKGILTASTIIDNNYGKIKLHLIYDDPNHNEDIILYNNGTYFDILECANVFQKALNNSRCYTEIQTELDDYLDMDFIINYGTSNTDKNNK